MKICETTLSFLEEDCVQTFGKEAGRALAARAEEAYQGTFARRGRQGQRSDSRSFTAQASPTNGVLHGPARAKYGGRRGAGVRAPGNAQSRANQARANAGDRPHAVRIRDVPAGREKIHAEKFPGGGLADGVGALRWAGDTLQPAQLPLLGTNPRPTAVRNCAPCIAKTTIFLFQDCCRKYALRARERWRAARIVAISILSERKCDFLKRNGGHSRKKLYVYLFPGSELHIGGPRRLSHRSRWRCAGCASGLGLPFFMRRSDAPRAWKNRFGHDAYWRTHAQF